MPHKEAKDQVNDFGNYSPFPFYLHINDSQRLPKDR